MLRRYNLTRVPAQYGFVVSSCGRVFHAGKYFPGEIKGGDEPFESFLLGAASLNYDFDSVAVRTGLSCLIWIWPRCSREKKF